MSAVLKKLNHSADKNGEQTEESGPEEQANRHNEQPKYPIHTLSFLKV